MIKTLIAYLQSRSKANKRIAELEKQLEQQTALRRKFEHEVSVWVARWENRDT
jgi:hypothetical protein